MTKSKTIALGVVLIVILAGALFYQQRSIQRFELENVRLRAQAAELDTLREDNSRLAKAQPDPAEAERLRKAQAELPRLRGEVAQLRQQLKEAQLAASRKTASTNLAPATPAETPPAPVETYTAATRVTLAPRQTVVTGGWMTREGRRSLVFVEPEFGGVADASGQITLRTRIVEMPDAVLTQLGLDGLKSDNKQSAAQAILTPEHAAAITKALESAPGVDVLAAPQISTADGRQAQVKVVDVKTIAGESQEVGPSIDITPRLSADRTSIELNISAQLRLQNPPATK